MAYHDQQQTPTPVVYPPPVTPYPPPTQSYPLPQPAVEGYNHGPYVTPPPPTGYPTRDEAGYPQQAHPIETKSRGDDFLKGCLAALCCCCVLDVCCC